MTRLAPLAFLAVFALLFAGCAGTTAPVTVTNTVTTTGDDGKVSTTVVAATETPYNPYAAPTKSTPVSGSGATFPKPLLEDWGIRYSHIQSKVQVSYAGGGSGKGISDITAKNVVFGATDAPLSPTEKANAQKNGETILQFPETLGLIAVVYNVEGLPNGIHLDGETVGKIFTGAISKWNDPAIATLNPGISLPDKKIAIVYRSDSSGTTFAYTDWLAHTSPSWANLMGAAASKKPDWTKSSASQLSGNGNDGVGSTVKTTPNSIGYVELAFVKSLNLDAAMIKSHDGEFLAPTTDGAVKDAASFASSLPAPNGDWSKVSIVDAPGEGAYPISTFTYIMVYDNLAAYNGKVSADQLNAFKAWMYWCLHEGQDQSESLGYAKLPSEVVKIGETALASIH